MCIQDILRAFAEMMGGRMVFGEIICPVVDTFIPVDAEFFSGSLVA